MDTADTARVAGRAGVAVRELFVRQNGLEDAFLAATVLSGLGGMALGGLLRHSGLAIGVFAVWAFVVEITLGVLARAALFAAHGVGAVAVALVAAVFTTARDGSLG